MSLNKRVTTGILYLGYLAMAFGILVGLAAFGRDVIRGQVNFSELPITLYTAWIGLVLVVGLFLGRFSPSRAAVFLSRWGQWPALLLVLLTLKPVQAFNWFWLQWPGFLIWFAPVAIVSLVLGARDMLRQNAA